MSDAKRGAKDDAVNVSKGEAKHDAVNDSKDEAKDGSVRAAMPDTAAILRMLGLAKRAGKLAVGTDATLNAARSGKAAIALVASDASDRTKKQIGDKCAAYGVTLIAIEADRSALAAALGSKDGQTSACAVTDRNMAIKIDSLTN